MHHMYTVGMDVDTFFVLFEIVIFLIIIWLFAGTFIKSMIPLTLSVLGKMSLLDHLFVINKQSAGNLGPFGPPWGASPPPEPVGLGGGPEAPRRWRPPFPRWGGRGPLFSSRCSISRIFRLLLLCLL